MKPRVPPFAQNHHRPASKPLSSAPTGANWRQSWEEGKRLVQAERPADALPFLQRAVEQAPDLHDPRRDLASALYRLGRLGDALREFNEVVTRFPDRSDAANNLAGVLSVMGHQTLALQAAERALSLDPANIDAMHNLAEILKHLGDWPGARDVYAASLSLAPDHAKARMQYGMALVALGDWRRGWEAMEARVESVGASVLFKERFTTPRWTGKEPIQGRRLLIQHEQGLGDAIMAARFAKQLAAMGAEVHLRTPDALVSLLGRVPGVTSCTAVGTAIPAHDAHIPLMSLMAALGITPEALDGKPYLAPGGETPHAVASLLPRDGTFTVALTWSGNPMHTNDHRRSIKGESLAPLLAMDGIRFVAMQKAPSMEEVLPESLRDRVIDIGAVCHSFDDSAHALQRVDLAIVVDTSVAHLAGALGVPTLLCLPFAPDYRWGVSGERTPWYDGMTLVRQSEPLQWRAVIEAAAERIRTLPGAPCDMN